MINEIRLNEQEFRQLIYETTINALYESGMIDEGVWSAMKKAAIPLVLGGALAGGIAMNKNPTTQKISNSEKTENVMKENSILIAPTINTYTPSDSIKQYIKKKEGFSSKRYICANGKPTIGYGFNISSYSELRNVYTITKEEADIIYEKIINKFTIRFNEEIMPLTKGRYTQKQLDALFSLFYNAGFNGSPLLKKAIENYDLKGIIKQMNHGYNQHKGLAIRRDEERMMFISDFTQKYQEILLPLIGKA